MKCPACNYDPEENDDHFIEIEGSSLHMRIEQGPIRSVNLIGCPKCKNIFME
ncbi:MAG: hypothetical protein ACFFD2_22530 [Promethearchaeota archaeon]